MKECASTPPSGTGRSSVHITLVTIKHPAGNLEATRVQHRGKARYVSGAAAHFSFLVHSPNVMKERASPPHGGFRLDPLKPGALQEATIMAGVALLELGRAAGA